MENRVRRRRFLKQAGALTANAVVGTTALNALAASGDKQVQLPFDNGARELVAFPQKRPLILLTSRPPQLETPFSVFNEGILTPNDAFFVRYHWSGIPTSVDPQTYRLRIGGKVKTPLELSLADIKAIAQPMEVVAVNQCSGNSRGFLAPRVNGGQLANGAMGNARWTGVPLKAVLERAGVQPGAVQVSFNGLDRPPLDNSPDFVKSLDIDHALDGEVMLAWSMNGEDLPMLNGYPLRLVVPGHYGTYWVKHLSDITVLDKQFDGFWVQSAYRIPDNAGANVEPGSAPARTRPIGRFNVRSFITSLTEGATVPSGRETVVRGIAFDGGYGIAEVAFSADGGRSWTEATLGQDLGKYSFREWRAAFRPPRKGAYDLRVRAVNRIGQSQPMTALWNPAGYMRNVVETTRVKAV
ncbi:sulfite dehydrogenase (cytochrome) subunit A [Cupriavidus metallidurans]|jgi:DMSO/TMAO reductase YedYZ molybdopterin-dependent catalytic subunit|uniref:SorA family sulfite dehydrogenase catalytic subunit n=1 Tax=Cupriavidus TaxID=106589 RepID=UPI000493442A|nr:molybdopterin-dependent oxidoreductase [Cupriavidus metallidurans]KWW35144.1 Sulfoxide reductase catalytic subunit YedY [Cupriavidus metallidurans]MDE4922325.1 molybdopterin-dependent oxidoreductase [Cupriavidus metallidurans]